MKIVSFFVVLIFVLLIIFRSSNAAVELQNPVDPLPADNLLDVESAWFRDLNAPPDQFPGGWGHWVNENNQGSISKGANKNPSPDDLDGTAVQWDEQTGCAVNDSCSAHLIVSAPTPHSGLRFQLWYVGLNLGVETAVIYGCHDANCAQETAVWTPWQNSSNHLQWVQSNLFETAIPQFYPYYKVRLSCQFSGGTAGCKYTGIYLAPTDTIGTATPTATSTAPPVPTSTATPIGTPESIIHLPLITR